jgi:HSP20 family protein
MSLIRWTPRRNSTELAAFRTEMDRLFEDLFRATPVAQDWAAITPPVDVVETPEAYVFRADLPGVDGKAVKVSVVGDTLTFRGERKRDEKVTEDALHRVERAYGVFERSFTLGTPVRADQVKASYRDGVLEIRVPKADEARPRDIEVQVS